MANKKFKISTGRLQKDAEQIRRLIDTMERTINDMRGSVQQMNSMWEGTAKQGFTLAFADDMKAMEAVLKELKALNGYEVQAEESYESCERQVGSSVQDMRI